MSEQLASEERQRIVPDYFSRYYSYIAPSRAGRPQDFKGSQQPVHPDVKDCVFCPGNEEKTPPEIGRIAGDNGSWRMRWFANKYGAVSPESPQAYGHHEVIVETPRTDQQLWDLTEQDFTALLALYQQRIIALSQDAKIVDIVVFKNHGKEAGASLVHSHTQIIASAMPLSNLSLLNERAQQRSACLYCAVLKEENASPRVIAQNDDFIAVCPKAPRFSLECWIIAKRHEDTFLQLGQKELENLAKLLQILVLRLRTINASYCYFLTYTVRNGQPHIHLDLLPRLHTWAGFEFAAGDYIITTPPEDAAVFYRNE